MITLLCGLLLLIGSVAAFHRLLPRNGVPHRLAVAPYLQVWIPVGLTGGVVMGAGFVVSGLLSLF